jgi:hypothetical protein
LAIACAFARSWNEKDRQEALQRQNEASVFNGFLEKGDCSDLNRKRVFFRLSSTKSKRHHRVVVHLVGLLATCRDLLPHHAGLAQLSIDRTRPIAGRRGGLSKSGDIAISSGDEWPRNKPLLLSKQECHTIFFSKICQRALSAMFLILIA